MKLLHETICKGRGHELEHFRYFNLLSMIYITFLMAATVMAYKVVNIWGVHEPGSTLIYTFTFFIGNIIAEVYGLSKAKKLIWESIIVGYVFALLITAVTALPSPSTWDLKMEFDKVLGHVLRFTHSGIIGYLFSAYINAYLIDKWKFKLKGRLFWVRSLFATSVSEGLATFTSGFITFFGMMSNKTIALLMFNAVSFKIVYGLIAVGPASFIAYLLKSIEKTGSERLIAVKN